MVYRKPPQPLGPGGRCSPPTPARWRCVFPPWRRWRTSLLPASPRAERKRAATCEPIRWRSAWWRMRTRRSPRFCYQTTSSRWPSPRCWVAASSWGLSPCSWRPLKEPTAGPAPVDLWGGKHTRSHSRKKHFKVKLLPCCPVGQRHLAPRWRETHSAYGLTATVSVALQVCEVRVWCLRVFWCFFFFLLPRKCHYWNPL